MAKKKAVKKTKKALEPCWVDGCTSPLPCTKHGPKPDAQRHLQSMRGLLKTLARNGATDFSKEFSNRLRRKKVKVLIRDSKISGLTSVASDCQSVIYSECAQTTNSDSQRSQFRLWLEDAHEWVTVWHRQVAVTIVESAKVIARLYQGKLCQFFFGQASKPIAKGSTSRANLEPWLDAIQFEGSASAINVNCAIGGIRAFQYLAARVSESFSKFSIGNYQRQPVSVGRQSGLMVSKRLCFLQVPIAKKCADYIGKFWCGFRVHSNYLTQGLHKCH